MHKPECRFAECRIDEDGLLVATVMRYGERARIGGVHSEEFKPGSLDFRDVVANVQHDRTRVIARTGGGGLTLTDGERELRMSLEFLPTREAQDARELARRGVLRGVSVEFHATKDVWQGSHRTVEAARLSGIALVTRPAYTGAKVEDVRAEDVTTVSRPRLLRF